LSRLDRSGNEGEIPDDEICDYRGGKEQPNAETEPTRQTRRSIECCVIQTALSVMAGLVPAIHAAPVPANLKLFRRLDDVDDRDKPGHDGVGLLIRR
jgi:hypothetical protein